MSRKRGRPPGSKNRPKVARIGAAPQESGAGQSAPRPDNAVAEHVPALLRVSEHETAAWLLFRGLMAEFLDCAASGRIKVWGTAAHAAVDLICSLDGMKIADRSALTPLQPTNGGEG